MTPNLTRLAPFLLGLAPLLAGCGQGAPKQAAAPPPAVTVAKPVKQTVTEYAEYTGRTAATDTVNVRARVSGYLDKILFEDGQIVKQGDLLFVIDRRPFETSVAQAQATLQQARANLAFADADLSRGAQLVRDKTITEQTFDQRTQAKSVAEASVAAQEAAVRQAELDLQFTELKAPVSGRIGDRRVSEGNLVTGGTGGSTTLLATIVSTDPIRFEFTFDESSFLRYERLGIEVKDPSGASGMEVAIRLIDEQDFTHKGRMDFVDNVIERASGTIRGRALVPNAKGLFTPGMFGRVRVPGSVPYEALLVPDVAIASEQVRKYVMVVDAENTVRQKYVTLGHLVGKGLRVIKEGLSADDRVVVNGLARIRPNVKVTPQEQGAEPPAAAPAPQAKS
jgi:RND family efflux transporter MFP subunit